MQVVVVESLSALCFMNKVEGKILHPWWLWSAWQKRKFKTHGGRDQACFIRCNNISTYLQSLVIRKYWLGVPTVTQRKQISPVSHEDASSIPCLAQLVKDPGLPWNVVYVADVAWIWNRCGRGLCRPAATALIPPIAWEPPYAVSVALKTNKQKNTCWRKEGSFIIR